MTSCIASYKKRSGRLTLTNLRFQWQADDAVQAEFVVPYDLIKAQHVNLAGSGKILLKLTLHGLQNQPESNHTFQFSIPEDREAVKSILTQKMAAARDSDVQGQNTTMNAYEHGKSSSSLARLSQHHVSASEIRARQTLLARDPELARFHREMVLEGIVDEETFWFSRKQQIIQQQFLAVQKKGATSASFMDIKPTSVEGTDVKYTLTPEIIHSIFVHHPAVQKAYQENVPLKMSETEFWKQYFLSKYFHGNSKTTSTGTSVTTTFQNSALAKTANELFEQYDEEEDMNAPRSDLLQVRNKLVDLTATMEDHLNDFGNEPDMTMKPGKVRESIPLIRKFNRHSEIVLKSTIKSTHAVNGTMQYLKETEIEDLEAKTQAKLASIDFIDQSNYFHETSNGMERDVSDAGQIVQKVSTYELDLSRMDKVVPESDACMMVEQFSARSLKRKREDSGFQDTLQEISKESMEQLMQTNHNAHELLRHFWSSVTGLGIDGSSIPSGPSVLPLSSVEAEEKKERCEKIIGALKKLQVTYTTFLTHTNSRTTIESLMQSVHQAITQAIHRYDRIVS